MKEGVNGKNTKADKGQSENAHAYSQVGVKLFEKLCTRILSVTPYLSNPSVFVWQISISSLYSC